MTKCDGTKNIWNLLLRIKIYAILYLVRNSENMLAAKLHRCTGGVEDI